MARLVLETLEPTSLPISVLDFSVSLSIVGSRIRFEGLVVDHLVRCFSNITAQHAVKSHPNIPGGHEICKK